ncbi:MAG: manganese efflux pump [Clostridia bacterium]|nr:manganese efflux pump [Clostridia bacterium]
MSFWELLILAAGLAMDAFAAAVCKGMSVQKAAGRHALTAGLWFGAFQALMPASGYLLGTRFASSITAIDHWIAFLLLGLLGANMIREAFAQNGESVDSSFGVRAMAPLAVATSIDALAVGVTFAFLGVRILPAVSVIGGITFALSALGVRLGNLFGGRFRGGAQAAGGGILILVGVRILTEHLGIFG